MQFGLPAQDSNVIDFKFKNIFKIRLQGLNSIVS